MITFIFQTKKCQSFYFEDTRYMRENGTSLFDFASFRLSMSVIYGVWGGFW